MNLSQTEFYSRSGAYSYLLRAPSLRGVILVDPTPECISEYAGSLGKWGHDRVFILETGSVRASQEASRTIAGRWRTVRLIPCDKESEDRVIPVGHGDLVNLGGLPIHVVGRVGRVRSG